MLVRPAAMRRMRRRVRTKTTSRACKNADYRVRHGKRKKGPIDPVRSRYGAMRSTDGEGRFTPDGRRNLNPDRSDGLAAPAAHLHNDLLRVPAPVRQRQIHELRAAGLSTYQIARETGVSQTQINVRSESQRHDEFESCDTQRQ